MRPIRRIHEAIQAGGFNSTAGVPGFNCRIFYENDSAVRHRSAGSGRSARSGDARSRGAIRLYRPGDFRPGKINTCPGRHAASRHGPSFKPPGGNSQTTKVSDFNMGRRGRLAGTTGSDYIHEFPAGHTPTAAGPGIAARKNAVCRRLETGRQTPSPSRTTERHRRSFRFAGPVVLCHTCHYGLTESQAGKADMQNEFCHEDATVLAHGCEIRGCFIQFSGVQIAYRLGNCVFIANANSLNKSGHQIRTFNSRMSRFLHPA